MKGRRKTVLKVAAVLCLATVCVGGVELAVCRFAAPDLYRRITDPVVAAAHRVGDAGSAMLDEAMQAGRSLVVRISAALKPDETETPPPDEETAEPEEPMESQLAEAPAVDDHRPIEDPAVTELSERDGLEVLTGGSANFVYYCQSEAPWADAPYGPDHVGGYGCGPTAMAMVVSTLTNTVVDPAQMAQWAYENGYCAPGSGSYLSIVEGMADDYGLTAVPFENWSADALCRELASGLLFVALMGPGHFTNGGHFIILRGITLEGKVLVADPNSRERSLAAWDPQLILDELSASRSNGAPLWRFSSLDPTR